MKLTTHQINPAIKGLVIGAILGAGILTFFSKTPLEKRFEHWANNYFSRKKFPDAFTDLRTIYQSYIELHKLFECDKYYNKNVFRKQLNRYLEIRKIPNLQRHEAPKESNKDHHVFKYNFCKY